MKRTLKLVGFMVFGLVIMSVLNYFILEKILIPDTCYYHSHDTNRIFDLFYELTAEEGYHPAPTKLNKILTLTSGTLIGLLFGIKRSPK